MSSLNDVLAAVDDFRSELFTTQHSESAVMTPQLHAANIRGMLGQVVTPLNNVHAVGVGIRSKKDKYFDDEFVIKVYVFQKVNDVGSLVPKILAKPFHGVDIDIEELPVMRIQAVKKAKKTKAKRKAAKKKKTRNRSTTPAQHQDKRRPIQGGVEIQPRGASFIGTLGGFVRSLSSPNMDVFALSNNHVLADTNELPFGTEITQPYSHDQSDVFACLTNFETIQLPSTFNPYPATNRMDAAIARVTEHSLVRTGSMFGISNYSPNLLSPTPGMKVVKAGRTTAVTKGRITAIRVKGVRVDYGSRRDPLIGVFDDCIQIVGEARKPFSDSGDSGSFVLDRSTGQPVALLFAGDGRTTTACDMTEVCMRFNVLPI